MVPHLAQCLARRCPSCRHRTCSMPPASQPRLLCDHLIERGQQSFTHQGEKLYTPPGGVILINPGEVHTGESAADPGFQMRSIYPTAAHMQAALSLAGRHRRAPYFRDVRVDHPAWAAGQRSLAQSPCAGIEPPRTATRASPGPSPSSSAATPTCTSPNSRWVVSGRLSPGRVAIWTSASPSPSASPARRPCFLSPYYLLRAFRAEVGMPPHAYQESLRIRHAQRLIRLGKPLAQVAAKSGFSSQSHLTAPSSRSSA